jgi:hypothetical protein
MSQLKDIQILYAFHFDSLPKNEHETRARFLPRSLEFSKRRNEGYFPRHEAIEAVALLLKKADI